MDYSLLETPISLLQVRTKLSLITESALITFWGAMESFSQIEIYVCTVAVAVKAKSLSHYKF
jgi:hypothetical protein